jgi:hypothetical protein
MLLSQPWLDQPLFSRIFVSQQVKTVKHPDSQGQTQGEFCGTVFCLTFSLEAQ